MSQRQSSGDQSFNLQAQTVVLGVTAEEARNIALDVFRANALQLQGAAQETAQARAEVLVTDFLSRLYEREDRLVVSLDDPDVQYGLFVAQRNYARTGDRDVGETLVDLLVDRCETATHELRAIVLDEALEAVGKLTPGEIAALTVHWLVTQVTHPGLNNLQTFAGWLREHLEPFAEKLPTERISYEHLVYTGCAGIEITELDIGTVFTRKHPDLFQIGLFEEELPPELSEAWSDSTVFIPCSNNPALKQVAALSGTAASQLAIDGGLPDELLEGLLESNLGPKGEVEGWLSDQSAPMARVVALWADTPLKNLRLTSVGIAIAHANWRRTTDNETPLSVWIPDGA